MNSINYLSVHADILDCSIGYMKGTDIIVKTCNITDGIIFFKLNYYSLLYNDKAVNFLESLNNEYMFGNSLQVNDYLYIFAIHNCKFVVLKIMIEYGKVFICEEVLLPIEFNNDCLLNLFIATNNNDIFLWLYSHEKVHYVINKEGILLELNDGFLKKVNNFYMFDLINCNNINYNVIQTGEPGDSDDKMYYIKQGFTDGLYDEYLLIGTLNEYGLEIFKEIEYVGEKNSIEYYGSTSEYIYYAILDIEQPIKYVEYNINTSSKRFVSGKEQLPEKQQPIMSDYGLLFYEDYHLYDFSMNLICKLPEEMTYICDTYGDLLINEFGDITICDMNGNLLAKDVKGRCCKTKEGIIILTNNTIK